MAGFKKYVRKAKKFVKRRYGGSSGVNQMLSDIKKLKMIVNAEKKQITLNNTPGTLSVVGAVNGDASGHRAIDITPLPTQDNTDSGRSGDSIKVVSGMLNFTFQQQPSTSAKVKVVVELWHTIKPQGDIDNNVVKLLYKNDPTLGNSMITTQSHIDQDYRGLFKLITKRSLFVGADKLASTHGTVPFKIPLKINKGFGTHFKYIENTDALALGQFILVVRADRGNSSGSTTSTTAGAIDTAVSTGIKFTHNITWYYYDN